MSTSRKRSPLASAGLHGTLLAAAFVAVFPVAWIVLASFDSSCDAACTPGTGGLGLGNYSRLLDQYPFGVWFLNSVIISAMTMVLGVFTAATAGYAVSRMRFPGSRAVMWMFLLVQMFPVAVLIVPLYNLMGRLHLLNNDIGLTLAYLTTSVPFSAWMLKGYFDTIPRSIDESGRLDGLSPFGTFWRLVMPLARPGIAVTAFYCFLTAWAEIAYANAFLTGDRRLTLAVGMRQLVDQTATHWGLMTAASVLVAVPAAAVFMLVQRHLVAGLTAGATKS